MVTDDREHVHCHTCGMTEEELAEFEERWLAEYRATPANARIQVLPPVSEWDKPERPCGKIAAIALVAAILIFAAGVAVGGWWF